MIRQVLRQKLISLTGILALGVPGLGFADTLFVSENAGGTQCTLADPCARIQQAVDLAAAGDSIVIDAGRYVENITIPTGKDGLRVLGHGRHDTLIVSEGGDANPKFAPAGVPADIIFDIFSPRVSISNLSLRHPPAVPEKRDIGVFVRTPAKDVSLYNLLIERRRLGDALEPTRPGSRGILVFRATGTGIRNNILKGAYEDHIHLPTSKTDVANNIVAGASRIGIVVIQENADSLSVENLIYANLVAKSASDGIQIQGDRNLVSSNWVVGNAGYGITLCGPLASPACVAPGGAALASDNLVKDNRVRDNALGAIRDEGENNTVK